MTASFVAYVDESGDEGFKFLPDKFIVGGKKNARMYGHLKKLQVLSSRAPPVRAAAITGNLYKSHAQLRFLFWCALPSQPQRQQIRSRDDGLPRPKASQ